MKYKNIERGFKRIGVACSLVWFLHVSLAYIRYEQQGNFDTNLWFFNENIWHEWGYLGMLVGGLLLIWVPICLIVGVGFRMMVWVIDGFREEETSLKVSSTSTEMECKELNSIFWPFILWLLVIGMVCFIFYLVSVGGKF
jgi:hypothetical protein